MEIYIECPHCLQIMELPKAEINCAIYRHGVFKHTMKQIDPHTPKELCDEYKRRDIIYGCGKPFKITGDLSGGNVQVECCEYI